MKKYRIEVEQIGESPPGSWARPQWEWRIWTRNADGTFNADFDVSGSERTAADAFEEAMGILDLSEAPKLTYSVCQKSKSGLHEWERLPPKQIRSLVVGDLSDSLNAVPAVDKQCALCGKLYSEHVT